MRFVRAAAGDGWDQHDLVAILKGVGLAAEEANVFVVNVNIDKAAQLAGFILDLGGKRGEVPVNVCDQRRQIGRLAGQLLLAAGVANEGGREDNLDGNG